MSLLDTLKFIVKHPLNRGSEADAVMRFAKWQIGSRLLPGPVVHEWIGGARFFVRHGETGLTGNLYAGLHEFADMAFVLHVLRDTDLFADIGANAGSYTLLACRAVGAAGVAFEPFPPTFQRLSDNVRLNRLEDRVRCLNMALGREPGTARFTSGLDTVNHILGAGEDDAGAVSVPVSTLDAALAGAAPAVMKIDVEGYELPVLEGGGATLRNEALLAVIMELNGSGERYGHDESRIAAMMRNLGFDACTYDPFERRLVDLAGAASATGNTLFVRQRERVMQRLKSAPPFKANGKAVLPATQPLDCSTAPKRPHQVPCADPAPPVRSKRPLGGQRREERGGFMFSSAPRARRTSGRCRAGRLPGRWRSASRVPRDARHPSACAACRRAWSRRRTAGRCSR